MRSVVQRLRQNAECKADNGLSMPKHEIVCLTLLLSHMMLLYIALCLSIVRAAISMAYCCSTGEPDMPPRAFL